MLALDGSLPAALPAAIPVLRRARFKGCIYTCHVTRDRSCLQPSSQLKLWQSSNQVSRAAVKGWSVACADTWAEL